MLTTLAHSIGNTPLIQLSRLDADFPAKILVKHEARNPAGSVKCRVAVALIESGIATGEITAETTIIEPTSGNTGIGLAFVCASKGLRLILTMPESMSIERRKLLKHLGAEIVLTPAGQGMKGAIAEAQHLQKSMEKSFVPDQFANPANPAIHEKTTGPEILRDTDGNVDILVVGVGTGGSISGIGKVLKNHNPEIQIIAVEPATSPVISGGNPGPHGIQGIGAGFIPENLDTDLLDEVIQVKDQDALAAANALAQKEGILCGISSGAAFWASCEVAKRKENLGKTIVTVLPDTGERYLSTALFA